MAMFDRVEWHIIPDPATAAAALQAGEVDWWEQPTIDLQPLLRKNGDIDGRDHRSDRGASAALRMNCLQPPFDNPAIRRALLSAVNQDDFMMAIVGDDRRCGAMASASIARPARWRTTPGIEVLAKRDSAAAQRDAAAAGYEGETVVLLAPTDFPAIGTLADVTADMLKKCRHERRLPGDGLGHADAAPHQQAPTSQGGWSCFTRLRQAKNFRSDEHNQMRGNGKECLVRLAHQRAARGIARRLVRGAGPGRNSSGYAASCSCRIGSTCRLSRLGSFSSRRLIGDQSPGS